MSLQKVEMHTVICDNCQMDIGMYNEYSCWNDENYAEENAMESDWHRQEDKHYCPDCYTYDDDDNFILVEERKDKYKIEH